MQVVPLEQCLISKKLTVIYCIYNTEVFIIFCYGYKHLSFSNKPYQPEMNFTENKYLLDILISYPGLLHVTE